MKCKQITTNKPVFVVGDILEIDGKYYILTERIAHMTEEGGNMSVKSWEHIAQPLNYDTWHEKDPENS